MKILYLAFVDFKDMAYGPAKKILSACDALRSMGHEVVLVGRNGNKTISVEVQKEDELGKHRQFNIGKFQTLLDKSAQIRDVCNFLDNKKFDICYIRYDLCTMEFIKLLRILKKSVNAIVLEVATYPYDKEYSGLVGKARLKYDAFWGKYLSKYVNRVISFYPVPSNSFFGVQVKTVPNGFDFEKVHMISSDVVPNDIDIAAISTMRNWHAYERIIQGFSDYYNGGKTVKRKVYLHLVGKGPDENKYRELVHKSSLDDYVIFHGPMSGEKLDNLLEKCEIGLDSLGRHRTGISVLSSLKSREYGAKGLPIINSCKIDVLDDDFPYLLRVPGDESNICVQDIIKFYDKVFAEKSRLKVACEIRNYIEGRCSMKNVMAQALEQLI